MENATEAVYIFIHEQRPRSGKPTGRPKGTCKFSDDERRERARLKSKKYYDMNPEKERERKILEYARKKRKFKKYANLENQVFSLAF